MRYLIVDACLGGTGIREQYTDYSYIEPKSLSLSTEILDLITDWLSRYNQEFYGGYKNTELVEKLDVEGKEIALKVKNSLSDVKVQYYSDAKLQMELL